MEILNMVIDLTYDLLATAKQNEITGLNIGDDDDASPSQHLSDEASHYPTVAAFQ